MYQFLNIFFFIFHTLLTLFNMFAWIPVRLRKWNLITLLLTAGSWFILGIWYGWGFCLCTEWHWQVREQLGYHDQSTSYIHFLVLKLTGADLDPVFVERATLAGFIIALILSIGLNVRDYRSAKSSKGSRS